MGDTSYVNLNFSYVPRNFTVSVAPTNTERGIEFTVIVYGVDNASGYARGQDVETLLHEAADRIHESLFGEVSE